MKISLKHLALIIVLVFISIKLHHKELNEFPKHIHAWGQSDYYSISLGFIDNGFDFFHPQNFVQNPEFPNRFKKPKNNGVTSADFPIHTYISALLMKSIGTEEPWVYRSYTLFVSIVGLFALFLLIKELNGSDIKALIGVLIVLLSPVYLYYRAGFLPSIPSLSNVIIAYYFYFKYLKNSRQIHFTWAILFFTLAALSRTPFAIFLIACFCQEALGVIKNRKVNFRILVPFITSFTFIIGYFIYNSYLREKYGSIFLGKPMPASSWDHAKQLISQSLENWKYHYLTKWHYLFITAATFVSIIHYIIKKEISVIHKQLLLNLSIVLLGVIIYSILMLQQFLVHDYYFIDTYLTPFILLTVFTLVFIKFNNLYLNLVSFILVSYCLYNMNINSIETQDERRETGSWDNTLFTIQNYTGGDKVLDNLNIPKEAKILVLDSDAPNIPFILLNRYGYTVHSLTKENIINKLNWNYDYIVAQNANIQKILSQVYPDLSKKIARVGGNNGFSIYKKSNQKQKQTIDQLLQLDIREPFYYNSIHIDSNWSKDSISIDSTKVILPEQEFGYTLELLNTKELIDASHLVKVTLDANFDNHLSQSKLIFSISEQEEIVLYQDRQLQEGENTYIFTTTPLINLDNKVKVYIWNPNKEKIEIKDFKIKMY